MALFNYECDEIKRKIDEVSPNYPQLTTFEREWLYFHKYHYIPGIPVELECETVSVNPYGSVSNAIPFKYKSAILKGQTLVNMVTLDTTKEYVLKQDGSSIKSVKFDLIDGFENDIYTIMLEMSNVNIVNPNGEWVVYIYSPSVIDNGADNTTIKSFIKNGRVSFTYKPSRGLKTENWFNIALHTDSGVGSTITIKNVVVLKGDHTREDIPYFEGMQSVKMPVLTTVGKNLCDINKYIHGGLSYNNSIIFRKDMFRSYYMKCKPSTTYVISVENSNNRFGVGTSHTFSEDTEFTINTFWVASGDVTGKTLQYTVTTTEIDKYLYVYSGNNGVFNPDIRVQVEESSSATSYEPFKSNILTVNEEVELGSVGDVKDELNLLTGELTQRTREVAYSNDMKISLYIPKENSFYLIFGDKLTSAERLIIADKIPHTSNWSSFINNPNLSCYSLANTYLYITIPSVGTVDEAKQYLSNLNPIFRYVLATESVKTVDLTTLNKPYEGTNHYQLSANIPCEAILEVPIVSTGKQTLEEINN